MKTVPPLTPAVPLLAETIALVPAGVLIVNADVPLVAGSIVTVVESPDGALILAPLVLLRPMVGDDTTTSSLLATVVLSFMVTLPELSVLIETAPAVGPP